MDLHEDYNNIRNCFAFSSSSKKNINTVSYSLYKLRFNSIMG